MKPEYETSNDTFCVVLNGRYYPIDWIPQLVDIISKSVFEKVLGQIAKVTPDNPPEQNYTVKVIATLTNRSVSTVTRHCRIGLLKGYKVGKSWLITEENYVRYKLNVHDE